MLNDKVKVVAWYEIVGGVINNLGNFVFLNLTECIMIEVNF